jgi:hypothetical protein
MKAVWVDPDLARGFSAFFSSATHADFLRSSQLQRGEHGGQHE